MLEIDLALSAEEVLLGCQRRGLVVTNERELAGKAGSKHWHLHKPGSNGTLEVSSWLDRVWVKVHPLREGRWVRAMAEDLSKLKPGAARVPSD